jgi:hypothetical protein
VRLRRVLLGLALGLSGSVHVRVDPVPFALSAVALAAVILDLHGSLALARCCRDGAEERMQAASAERDAVA